MKPTDFAYYLSEYLSKYLPGQLGLSSNTIKSYRDTFILLLQFFTEKKGVKPEKLTLKHIDVPAIEEFLLWIEKERKCSISTRNQRLAAIHAFYQYLQTRQPENILSYQQIMAVKHKESPKPFINHLSLEGIKLLLAQPDTYTSRGRRDLVLLSLLYDSGARVQELVDICVGDVRIEEPATVKLTGKGNKSRITPLMPQTASLLNKYLDEQNLKAVHARSYPLFFSHTRQKLTRAGVAYILKKYYGQAKTVIPQQLPDKISPHSLRHSKAMHLLQAGVNIVYIRDILGHVELGTTEVYAKADAEAKRKALEKGNPNIISSEMPTWQRDDELYSWLKSF